MKEKQIETDIWNIPAAESVSPYHWYNSCDHLNTLN